MTTLAPLSEKITDARALATQVFARTTNVVVEQIGSRWAFGLILVLFVASGSLIALSMSLSIYDEHWHLGIIQQYATQLSPRLANSDATAGLGDVEHTGSFLFHWLMSFPYRLFSSIWGDGYVNFVLTRLVCVLLVTAGLVVWRRALLLLTSSTAIVNISLSAIASIPLLSFVAATVNYDNLLFLLAAAWAYMVFRIAKRDGAYLLDWVWALVFGLAACITKFSFIPVFAAVGIYLLIRYAAPLVTSLRERRHPMPVWRLIVGLALLALLIYANAERYVVNMFRFGTPDPSCDVVATHEYCMTYGVYARNFGFAQANEPGEGSLTGAVGTFFADWLPSMLSTLGWLGVRTETGAVLDTYGGMVTRPLLYTTGILVIGLALLLGRVLPEKFRWPIWISITVHTAALYYLNYSNLVEYGLLFAYSARYFFPYLPMLITLAVAGLAVTLTKISRAPRAVAIGIVFVAFAFMTQGGGPLTYLNALDESWLHPESPIRGLVLFLGRVADRAFVIG